MILIVINMMDTLVNDFSEARPRPRLAVQGAAVNAARPWPEWSWPDMQPKGMGMQKFMQLTSTSSTSSTRGTSQRKASSTQMFNFCFSSSSSSRSRTTLDTQFRVMNGHVHLASKTLRRDVSMKARLDDNGNSRQTIM